jgi:hypothetical protein
MSKQEEQQQQQQELQLGDRVVLHGLIQAAHLNGRHGVVAAILEGGRCAVHLDVLRPVTISIQLVNLKKEDPATASYAIQDRCAVFDGVIVDSESPIAEHLGKATIQIFHLMRSMVVTSFPKDVWGISSMQQIPNLPADKSNDLNAYAVTHWNDGVYDRFVEFVKAQGFAEDGVLVRALNDARAMKSWHLGMQQDFWFVGRDYTGTYIVPECSKDVVYKVVGVVKNTNSLESKKKPGDPVSIIKIPMRLKLTVLPWYGRLLYDSTIPPLSEEFVVQANDPALAHRLHSVVLKSIQAGTVIEHLAELEDSEHESTPQPFIASSLS